MPIVAASTDNIERAGESLRAGGLVAMPTETVYGLAGDATDGLAVAAIYAAKGRPRFNPLIVHVASVAQAAAIGELTPLAERLARAFWPGPLTLVLQLRPGCGIADLVTAGLDTVAIRVPGHEIARALIEAAGRPLAAPSANKSGRISPTRPEHVAADFGDELPMILDGGPCGHGLESTIIACQTAPPSKDASGEGLVLLRPGAIAVEQIEAACGHRVMRAAVDPDAPTSPGQLLSHYAPRALVRLNAVDLMPGEALLAFGANVPPADGAVINLSKTGDLREAAKGLFAALRALDASGAGTIAVMPIPDHGLGEAINDRLVRAAAAR